MLTLQIDFLNFASLPGFLTKETQIKNKKLYKILSWYVQGQLKIKLQTKEYKGRDIKSFLRWISISLINLVAHY